MRTLQDIAVGQPRREAYLALADRTGVADLRRFIRAVVQADAYGVSIADVLRTQAQEMRLKRRQRAEEKAMQIPVKVIFPLILCILPTLFIVLLGPAAMDIAAAFSNDRDTSSSGRHRGQEPSPGRDEPVRRACAEASGPHSARPRLAGSGGRRMAVFRRRPRPSSGRPAASA